MNRTTTNRTETSPQALGIPPHIPVFRLARPLAGENGKLDDRVFVEMQARGRSVYFMETRNAVFNMPFWVDATKGAEARWAYAAEGQFSSNTRVELQHIGGGKYMISSSVKGKAFDYPMPFGEMPGGFGALSYVPSVMLDLKN